MSGRQDQQHSRRLGHRPCQRPPGNTSVRICASALEPLTYVRAFYDVKEGQDVARLDACEVWESPLASEVSYARAVQRRHLPPDALGVARTDR